MFIFVMIKEMLCNFFMVIKQLGNHYIGWLTRPDENGDISNPIWWFQPETALATLPVDAAQHVLLIDLYQIYGFVLEPRATALRQVVKGSSQVALRTHPLASVDRDGR